MFVWYHNVYVKITIINRELAEAIKCSS